MCDLGVGWYILGLCWRVEIVSGWCRFEFGVSGIYLFMFDKLYGKRATPATSHVISTVTAFFFLYFWCTLWLYNC